MSFIDKLAIIYQISIDINNQKYIFIGHTFDLLKTQDEILHKLRNGKHENINLQNKFNELIETDPKPLGLYFRYETLQALRPSYYPKNVLPMLMELLEQSYIKTIYEDYKTKGKEYLILNSIDDNFKIKNG